MVDIGEHKGMVRAWSGHGQGIVGAWSGDSQAKVGTMSGEIGFEKADNMTLLMLILGTDPYIQTTKKIKHGQILKLLFS